jgi:hypothetical protein
MCVCVRVRACEFVSVQCVCMCVYVCLRVRFCVHTHVRKHVCVEVCVCVCPALPQMLYSKGSHPNKLACII